MEPGRILLDRSFHHSGMLKLEEGERRGRPDLVHTTLLSITGTPLYMDGKIRIYIHTRNDVVLEIKEGTRIPKSYFRFRGLMEQQLGEQIDEDLVQIYELTLESLIRRKMTPDLVLGLSVQGRDMKPREFGQKIVAAREPCLVIGGFPRGHFSPANLRIVDELVRLGDRPLDAHVVASRIVYEVEKAVSGVND